MATVNATSYQDYAHDGPGGVDVSSQHTFAAGAADGDVVRMCKLRAGTKVTDLSVIIEDATASLTVSAGYAPVDGSTADADAFIAADTAAATAGRIRANAGVAPLVLDRDAYLTVTVGGAALAADDAIVAVPTVQTVGL